MTIRRGPPGTQGTIDGAANRAWKDEAAELRRKLRKRQRVANSMRTRSAPSLFGLDSRVALQAVAFGPTVPMEGAAHDADLHRLVRAQGPSAFSSAESSPRHVRDKPGGREALSISHASRRH